MAGTSTSGTDLRTHYVRGWLHSNGAVKRRVFESADMTNPRESGFSAIFGGCLRIAFDAFPEPLADSLLAT